MEAQVSGDQRKVVTHEVRPLRSIHGESGIPLADGRTLPFRVARAWSAPAGVYMERMFLIDPDSREVLFEGRERETAVWGLQSFTEVVDEITVSIALKPGRYAVVFALDSTKGGEFEIEAFEAQATVS